MLVESPVHLTHSSKVESTEISEAELVGPVTLYNLVNFDEVN